MSRDLRARARGASQLWKKLIPAGHQEVGNCMLSCPGDKFIKDGKEKQQKKESNPENIENMGSFPTFVASPPPL